MTNEVPTARGAGTVRWGPKATYIAPVESLPFQALYEEVLREGGQRETATGAIYRDSRGRLRREYRVAEGSGQEPINVVVINDFAARSAIWLDVATKTATRFTDFGPPPGESLQGWAFEGLWSAEEGAEKKMIEGVLCRKVVPIRTRLGTPPKPIEAGEIWISNELKYSILERITGPETEYAWRVYSIRRTEPPHSLFVAPTTYTAVSRSKLDSS